MAKSVLFFVVVLVTQTEAHPGAMAEGRGSCDAEFNTAGTAFHIPDIREAWYVRRVGTCSHPFFWVTFDTTSVNQQVTFVAASPEVADFQDKLDFNAVLFGPGYSQGNSWDMPAALVEWEVLVPRGVGSKALTSPASFSSCDFVSNPVMRNYKALTNGRCMEHMTMAPDFAKPALAGNTWNNWWLASHDLEIPVPGKYFLVVWASDRGTGKVTSGRIEVTLGPWAWSGYASASTTAQAQSQSSTCSCATNHASWYAQNLDMIGGVSPSLFSSQLPFQVCNATGADSNSFCHAGIKSAQINGNNESSVEWSGLFELEAGTYDWNFFAFKQYAEWKFPDATMDVVIVRTNGIGLDGLQGAESAADAAMTASLAGNPGPTLVSPSGTITAGGFDPVAFRILLPEPNGTTNVTFKLSVPTKGSYTFFTQHRPSEFLSEQFTCISSCVAGSYYVFWKHSKTYGVSANNVTQLDVQKARRSTRGSSTSACSASSVAGLMLLTLFWLCVPWTPTR